MKFQLMAFSQPPCQRKLDSGFGGLRHLAGGPHLDITTSWIQNGLFPNWEARAPSWAGIQQGRRVDVTSEKLEMNRKSMSAGSCGEVKDRQHASSKAGIPQLKQTWSKLKSIVRPRMQVMREAPLYGNEPGPLCRGLFHLASATVVTCRRRRGARVTMLWRKGAE